MSVLANCVLHINSRHKGGTPADDSALAIKYHTQAVKIVNERLDETRHPHQMDLSVFDATIGGVTGLICNAVRLDEPKNRLKNKENSLG